MGMTVIRRVLTKKLLSELEKGRTRWVRMNEGESEDDGNEAEGK